jgi:hypothetical protein
MKNIKKTKEKQLKINKIKEIIHFSLIFVVPYKVSNTLYIKFVINNDFEGP